MKKKLDTRFPAARIKKIMQTDDDVGKIAMAVPLLVSKALELFLQDLCDRTYEITLQRGAKTMSSFHLKQCVQSFNVFDFLKEIVGKVPELGGLDAGSEEKPVSKRRKVIDDEETESDEEPKRSRMQEAGETSSSGKGRGKGRGRGRGRSTRAGRNAAAESGSRAERNNVTQLGKFEDDDHQYMIQHNNIDKQHISEHLGTMSDPQEYNDKNEKASVRNFDLNVDLNENEDSTSLPAADPTILSINPTRETEDSTSIPAADPASLPVNPTPEIVHEEYSGWTLSDVQKMAIDPIELIKLNSRVDEDEEDYDEEG